VLLRAGRVGMAKSETKAAVRVSKKKRISLESKELKKERGNYLLEILIVLF
jgi:hypothetical protein